MRNNIISNQHNTHLTSPTPLIFLTCCLLFGFFWQTPEIIGFESRFVVFAQEMLRNGPSIFPTTYDQAYPDYTALMTFFTYLIALPSGRVSHFTAILPTVICSAGITAVTYRLVALYDRRWAIYAVLLLLSSHIFISQARSISLDQCVSFVTQLTFYYLIVCNKNQRIPNKSYLLLYCFIAFCIRGPLGLVITTGVVVSYFITLGNWRSVCLFGIMASGLLCLLWCLLLLCAYSQAGETFVQTVIKMQITSRVHSSQLSNPIYHYLMSSIGNYAPIFPLALITILTLPRHTWYSTQGDHRLLRYCIAYAAIILIGMSASNRKPSHYIIAMAPPLAIIASYHLYTPTATYSQTLIKRFTIQLFRWLSPFTLMSLLFVIARGYYRPYYTTVPIYSLFIILFCTSLLTYISHRYKSYPTWVALVSGVVCLLLIQIGLVQPIKLQHNKTHHFVTTIEQKRQALGAETIFYQISADGLAIKWLVQLDGHKISPQFFTHEHDLIQYRNCNTQMVISEKQAYRNLSQTIKNLITWSQDGFIGHHPVVVFTLPMSEACNYPKKNRSVK